MATLSREVSTIQNTALAATLLWRAACGYDDASESTPCPLPLIFLVLPILFQQDSAEFVIHTRKNSGLQLFAQKFADTTTSKNDVLLSINNRAIAMRPQTLEALRLSISKRLIAMRIDVGCVFPISTTAPIARIPEAVRPLLDAAEKFGYWCGQLTLFEIQQLLKVRL
jgi:hypothetical protein